MTRKAKADFPSAGVRRPRPVAVVYSDDSTGPADGDDTGAMAVMLTSAASWNFDGITAGPNGTMSVPEALVRPEVRLYAQPGADGDDTVYRRQKRDKPAIKHFVHNGGRYLGICMGGFLAEATPEWYREANLNYGGSTQDLGDDLIGALMAS